MPGLKSIARIYGLLKLTSCGPDIDGSMRPQKRRYVSLLSDDRRVGVARRVTVLADRLYERRNDRRNVYRLSEQ